MIFTYLLGRIIIASILSALSVTGSIGTSVTCLSLAWFVLKGA